jgi:hypothetical protein
MFVKLNILVILGYSVFCAGSFCFDMAPKILYGVSVA